MRGLANAVHRREEARGARLAAEAHRQDHVGAAAREEQAERRALARGELRVADLERIAAWALGVHAEEQRLAARVDRARDGEAQASRAEADARALVGKSRAEAEVVDRARARWNDAARKTAEARDEEASLEAWGSRR